MPNRVRLDSGVTSYVRCGADIMLTGLFQDVDGDARCPICGTIIHISIKNSDVVLTEPATTLLHYFEYPVELNAGGFGIVCEKTYLFDRKKCLDYWKGTQPNQLGKVATPADFFARVQPRRTGTPS